MSAPRLTVVVAPVGDGSALPGCLEALQQQQDPPSLEVIVPVDASVRDLERMRRAFPDVIFLDVEGTAEDALSGDIGTAHLAIDRRRAAALAAARGEIVAVAEEHGRPDPDWCHNLSGAHRDETNAVIGGAVVNTRPRLVNWALFFMDAGRYQNPVPEGPVQYVTDVNVSYKREALLRVQDVWREMYMETDVHDALARLGEVHRLRRDLVMAIDRGPLSLRYALAERFAWARLYAGRRAATVSGARRWLLALGTPLLGPLLAVRQAELAFGRGQHRGAFLRCLPLLLLMDFVWSLGELTGYLTGAVVDSPPN